MKTLNLLILIVLISPVIWGQNSPLLNNEFVTIHQALILSASLDNNDNIVMSGSKSNFSEIRMNKPNGELLWNLIVDEGTSYGAIYATFFDGHIYALYADSLRKISFSGTILKAIPLPRNGWGKIYAKGDNIILLPYISTVASEAVYVYNSNLDLIEIIDSAYVGHPHSFCEGENKQYYIASARQDGVGIHTNSAVDFLKYDGQELIWRTQIPDVLTPGITFSNGRVYFSVTDYVPYGNEGGVKLGWTYGELNDETGSILWKNTWVVPWYPANILADAWSDAIIANKPGGFIITGSATKPGLDTFNIDPNRRWPLSIAFNENGDSLWSVLIERSGAIKGGFWGKNNHLFLWGQSGEGYVQVYTIPGITSVRQIDEVPQSFSLSQNYPNPFNPTTLIRFSTSTPENVTLKVYDLIGQEVAILVNEYLNAGTHEVEFNGQNLASGTYFYILSSGGKKEFKKMVLLK